MSDPRPSGIARPLPYLKADAVQWHRLAQHLLSFALLASGLVDLPRRLDFGGLSTLAVLTVLYNVGAFGLYFVLIGSRLALPAGARAFLFFLVWATVSLVWSPARFEGAQNLLVYSGFLGFLLLARDLTARWPHTLRLVSSNMSGAVWFATALYAVSLVVGGPGANWPLGARGFALFALLGVSWILAGWLDGSGRGPWPLLLFVAMIALSLSRTAFVTAVLLIPIAFVAVRQKISVPRLLVTCMVSASILYAAIVLVPPIAERFVIPEPEGPASEQDIRAFMTGRYAMWSLTWDSFLDRPWTGHGAGSAGAELAYLLEIAHPHNDYLRVLHDYGVLGFAVFVLAVILLGWRLFRGLRKRPTQPPRVRRIRSAAFLGIIATLLSMLTDNTAVYVYHMVPLGILVGVALGSEATRPPKRRGNVRTVMMRRGNDV
ncbi:MAG: O-antigen ligase family protein [Acidobacteria bacterium]|nr:O-antigen ligase family protein [Acidobacteriota bacterium]